MANVTINLISDNKVREKDDVLRDMLSALFDHEYTIEKMEGIIDVAGEYGFGDLAEDMQAELNQMPGYKAILRKRKRELDADDAIHFTEIPIIL